MCITGSLVICCLWRKKSATKNTRCLGFNGEAETHLPVYCCRCCFWKTYIIKNTYIIMKKKLSKQKLRSIFKPSAHYVCAHLSYSRVCVCVSVSQTRNVFLLFTVCEIRWTVSTFRSRPVGLRSLIGICLIQNQPLDSTLLNVGMQIKIDLSKQVAYQLWNRTKDRERERERCDTWWFAHHSPWWG